MSKSLYIGLDFDGTMVEHKYPEIGEPVEYALDIVRDLIAMGHKIILYTMRSGERLVEAVEYLESEGIELYAVNENPSQKYWTVSPKIFCHIYIDDCSLGVPLVPREGAGRPVVDWVEVENMLKERGVL